MQNKSKYNVIGVMSGTSMDGLDLCFACFETSSGKWSFEIKAVVTYSYPEEWVWRLQNAHTLKKLNLESLDMMYGQFIGKRITQFIRENNIQESIDAICSHGHTIFHEPDKGITVQIGDGESIANLTGITVVNDFRTMDVSLGGQGAPLVPIGDHHLFSDYDACLNLGGFSNISFEHEGKCLAFDISPANLPLNKIMKENFDRDFDEGGAEAKKGKVISSLLDKLNGLGYYKLTGPKSLAVEWLNADFYPLIDRFAESSPNDLLRTIVEHETNQLVKVFERYDFKNVLISGGGARNHFLMDCLKKKTSTDLIIPEDEILDFKEALIFGFLGVLRLRNEINTLLSVTGASKDSVGGKVHSVD